MASTTSFASMACLSPEVLLLNATMAVFSGVLSLLALSQIVRIHMRVHGWTRQKVMHLLVGLSNMGYCIYFLSTHFATCSDWICWSHACGFVLMAYPRIIFLSSYLLLLSFWVDLCHETNDDEDDDDANSSEKALLENSKHEIGSSSTDGHRGCCSFQSLHFQSRQKFVIGVVTLLLILMTSFSIVIGIGAVKDFFDTSLVSQVYEDIIGISILLLGGALGCYGLSLFLKLRKVRSEIASSEKRKVTYLGVTSIVCFTSSALVAIFTDTPLYYHRHLKKMYGAKVVIFLILYYLIGSLVPSAVLLWIMRDLPHVIIHRPEQSRIVAFVRHIRTQRQPQPT